MTQDEFREYLWAGHGRAAVYARSHDVAAFRDVILDACLYCRAIDPQCEGTRAGYMLEFVQHLPDTSYYTEAVLRSLPQGGDDWDAAQRFHFATHMAMEGDPRAKSLVYENFRPGPRMGEGIGIDFVRLDGMSGFLFAAEKMGELWLSGTPDVDEGWLFDDTIARFEEEVTLEALRRAAPGNAGLGAYLEAVETRLKQATQGAPRVQTKGLSYQELLAVRPKLSHIQVSGWGERTSEENLRAAALGLLMAASPEDQMWHFRIFWRRSFPLDPSCLLDWAKSSEQSLARGAYGVLEEVTHPSVRQLAFDLQLNGDPERSRSVAMLTGNFQHGDHSVVLEWFAAEKDLGIRHSLGRGLRKLWKRHAQPDTEIAMLRTLYERQSCSECREFALCDWLNLEPFTDELRAECLLDASHEIRSLAGEAATASPLN